MIKFEPVKRSQFIDPFLVGIVGSLGSLKSQTSTSFAAITFDIDRECLFALDNQVAVDRLPVLVVRALLNIQ